MKPSITPPTEPKPEIIMGCLKLISGGETLTLEPTNGSEMISNESELFSGYLDINFRNYGCNVNGQPTKEQNVQVHEMIRDGTFAQIYAGLGDNLDALCLSQGQIIQFVRKHRKWLRTNGYGTFFLFKVDDFFVANVNVNSDGDLEADVRRFDHGRFWDAEFRHRFVIPQLALGN